MRKLWIALASVVLAQAACGDDSDSGSLKVGFIYDGATSDIGWSYQLDQGRLAIEAAFPDVRTLKVTEHVTSANMGAVVDDMVSEGVRLIFGPGCCYTDAIKAFLAKHPDLYFENVNDTPYGSNMSAFYGRMYEAMYLAGIVAGRMTQTGKIGYVAAWRHHSVVRPLNAFAVGVRSVNPTAEVHVEWVNTWYNPDMEKAKADVLLGKGVDIIAGHTDSPARLQAAKNAGKMGIGFHSDMLSLFPDSVITSGVWNWAPYYRARVQAVLDKTWKSQNFWGGLKDEVVTLGEFGASVPQSVKDEVAAKRAMIESGALIIFQGELRNNQGTEWIAAGVALTDDQLRMMDSVFAEGVVVDPAAGLPPS